MTLDQILSWIMSIYQEMFKNKYRKFEYWVMIEHPSALKRNMNPDRINSTSQIAGGKHK